MQFNTLTNITKMGLFVSFFYSYLNFDTYSLTIFYSIDFVVVLLH